MVLNFNKYFNINEAQILDFLEFGNQNNKRLPKTEAEVKYDQQFSNVALRIYDEIFGTNFSEKYKDDLSLLVKDPTIKKITSGEVVNRLIELTYQPNTYSQFDISITKDNNIEDILLKELMNSVQNKEVSSDNLLSVLDKLPSKSRTKKFLYDLYLNYGNNFDRNCMRQNLDIKGRKVIYHQKKELEELPKMDETLEKCWWKCIKWSMNHYKDFFDTKEMLNKAFDKFIEIFKGKDRVIQKYLDNNIKIFKEELLKISKQ